MRIQHSLIIPECLKESNAPNFARAITHGFERIGPVAVRTLRRPNLTPFMRWESQRRGTGYQLFPSKGKWPFVEAGVRPHFTEVKRKESLGWGGSPGGQHPNHAEYRFNPGHGARPWLADGFEHGASGPWMALMVDAIRREFPK